MTRLLRRTMLLLALLALAAAPVVAQEPPAAAVPVFGMALGIGVASFPEGTFQSIRLAPDLAFGKFGIGLDVKLNYRFTGTGSSFEIRRADWVPAPFTFQSFLATYLPKITYLRWAEKGDPLYVKFGSIDDGTIGNGFVVGDYANTLFLPEDRHFGLSFDLDGQLFGFPLLGFESFVGNIAQLDVLAARLYVRPLLFTKIPILSQLEVGGSFATDRDPYLYASPGTPGSVLVVDGDLMLPILTSPVVSLAAYTDIASITSNESWGGMVGVGGRLFSFLTWGAQLRVLGEGFLPVYFDETYDLYRAVKYDLVTSADPATIPASMGWFASIGTSFLGEKIVFRVGLDGPFIPAAERDPANIAHWPHLRGVFLIAEGIVPGLSFDASYDKKLITTFASLVNPADAAIQARLNYKTGPAVLSFVYKLRYDPLLAAAGSAKPWVVTSGLESTIELF